MKKIEWNNSPVKMNPQLFLQECKEFLCAAEEKLSLLPENFKSLPTGMMKIRIQFRALIVNSDTVTDNDFANIVEDFKIDPSNYKKLLDHIEEFFNTYHRLKHTEALDESIDLLTECDEFICDAIINPRNLPASYHPFIKEMTQLYNLFREHFDKQGAIDVIQFYEYIDVIEDKPQAAHTLLDFLYETLQLIENDDDIHASVNMSETILTSIDFIAAPYNDPIDFERFLQHQPWIKSSCDQLNKIMLMHLTNKKDQWDYYEAITGHEFDKQRSRIRPNAYIIDQRTNLIRHFFACHPLLSQHLLPYLPMIIQLGHEFKKWKTICFFEHRANRDLISLLLSSHNFVTEAALSENINNYSSYKSQDHDSSPFRHDPVYPFFTQCQRIISCGKKTLGIERWQQLQAILEHPPSEQRHQCIDLFFTPAATDFWYSQLDSMVILVACLENRKPKPLSFFDKKPKNNKECAAVGETKELKI